MTPAERSLLITLARLVREDIWRWTRPGQQAKFDLSEIDAFRKMMDEEEVTNIACEQIDTIPQPKAAMPETGRRTEGYRPQPGPRPAAPNTGSGVQPSSGGSSVNRPLPFEMEAALERKQQQVANLACALQAAWNVLTDVSLDPDVRIARAIVSLAGARP